MLLLAKYKTPYKTSLYHNLYDTVAHLLHTLHIMATITKTPSGKYRVFVSINYKRFTKTFKTKNECHAWAMSIDPSIETASKNKTYADVLIKYKEEISATKQGKKWEIIRINALINNPIANVKLQDINKTHIVEWRNRRLKMVRDGTVLREWNLLRHTFEMAIKEWGWMKDNPMKGVPKPKPVPPRDRLISDDEISRLCYALNYTENVPLPMLTQRVGAAFLFAIETALRAQEICNLRWDDIKGRVAKINASKTLAGVRQVPLSAKAIAIIEQVRGVDNELVFGLKTSQLDSLFRKAKKQVLIENLHFHDSRHQAITNLAKKLDVLELARMVGHKDLNMLLVYYNATAESLADKL